MDTGCFKSKSLLFLFKVYLSVLKFWSFKRFEYSNNIQNILIKDRIIDGDFSDLDALSCYCGFQTGGWRSLGMK